jgi:hypothetical protein
MYSEIENLLHYCHPMTEIGDGDLLHKPHLQSVAEII